MTRSFLALLVLTVIASGVRAAEHLTTESQARALAESAMKFISGDKINEAFAVHTPHWPMPKNEIDTLILKTIEQRNVVEPRFGKARGYIFVREEKLGDFVLRYTYAEKRERHVLRWRIMFYKAADEWLVNSIAWDDRLDLLFPNPQRLAVTGGRKAPV